jgi:hypothetical protein
MDKMISAKPEMSYEFQAARDAQSMGYSERYCRYLDESSREHYDYFLRRGDHDTAESILTRSLSEALQGNEGI